MLRTDTSAYNNCLLHAPGQANYFVAAPDMQAHRTHSSSLHMPVALHATATSKKEMEPSPFSSENVFGEHTRDGQALWATATSRVRAAFAFKGVLRARADIDKMASTCTHSGFDTGKNPKNASPQKPSSARPPVPQQRNGFDVFHRTLPWRCFRTLKLEAACVC